ncbi:MAG: phosphoribosyltransferase family protein [Candidatus Zixiibacteriota bacterium]
MNLKEIFKDYFLSWFHEPEFDYSQLSGKKRQKPIKLSGEFDYGRALGLYRYDSTPNKTILGEFMYRFKYKDDEKCGQAIAEYLMEFLESEQLLESADFITTVPVALTNRKFIVMRYIVEQFDETVQKKYRPDLLIRKKYSSEIKDITDINERKISSGKKFAVKSGFDIENKNIILIDDIYDSGATLNACGHALKEAGANQIMAITITSTGRKAR